MPINECCINHHHLKQCYVQSVVNPLFRLKFSFPVPSRAGLLTFILLWGVFFLRHLWRTVLLGTIVEAGIWSLRGGRPSMQAPWLSEAPLKTQVLSHRCAFTSDMVSFSFIAFNILSLLWTFSVWIITCLYQNPLKAWGRVEEETERQQMPGGMDDSRKTAPSQYDTSIINYITV